MDEEYISHNVQLMQTWCDHFNREGACPVIAIGVRYANRQLTMITVENYDLKDILQIVEDTARYMRQMMQ